MNRRSDAARPEPQGGWRIDAGAAAETLVVAVGAVTAALAQLLVTIGVGSAAAIAAALLAIVAAGLALRSGGGTDERPDPAAMALLAAAVAVTSFDPVDPGAAFRLLRVGVVVFGGATVVTGLLVGRIPGARALPLIIPALAATGLWLAEATVVLPTGPVEKVVPPALFRAMQYVPGIGWLPPVDTTVIDRRDDPLDGYLEPEDTRSSDWVLNVSGDSRATLALPPDSSRWLRVDIARAPRGPMWHINLVQGDLAVEPLHAYLVGFRARSSRSRRLEVGFTQGHPPWRVIGFYEGMDLTSEWRRFEQSFVSAGPEASAQLQFNLGGDTASVEIADVEIHDEDRDAPLRPGGRPTKVALPYRFDSLGCREPQPAAEAVGREHRVVLVGGAAALGVGLRVEDALRALLAHPGDHTGARAFPPVVRRVFACAAPGSGLPQAATRGRTLADRLDADVVLIVLGPDVGTAIQQHELDDFLTDRGPLLRLSHLLTRAAAPRLGRRLPDVGTTRAEIAELRRSGVAEGRRYLIALMGPASDAEWRAFVQGVSAGDSNGMAGVIVIDTDGKDGRTAERATAQLLDSALTATPGS